MTTKRTTSDVDAKVIKALTESKWKYRTVKGIAKETNLDSRLVEESLSRNKPVVRVSIAKASDGSALYASKKKVSAVGDVWMSFKAMNRAKYGK